MSGSNGQNLAEHLDETYHLQYSTDVAVWLFLGIDQHQRSREHASRLREEEGRPTNIWVGMTRQDIQDADAFGRALNRYLLDAVQLGMTHYYPHFGDIMIFPIPPPPPLGSNENRLEASSSPTPPRNILRTEPQNGGQIFSVLPEVQPEAAHPPPPLHFPSSIIITTEQLVAGNPLDAPCRQASRITTTTGDGGGWAESVETVRRLRALGDEGALPPGLVAESFEVLDGGGHGHQGRGAWHSRRLDALLTGYFLERAVNLDCAAGRGRMNGTVGHDGVDGR